MNALPVGPQHVADPDARMRYFDDLARWGFDIAYNAYYAFAYEDVVGRFRHSYTAFVEEAHNRGYPACIQIQSTVCAGDRLTVEEAQYNLDDTPERWGESGFFASFSSEAWKAYLNELTTIFVQDYGFDYVVFEEPMYRVDIPGPKDRFYARFTAANPDLRYPERRSESAEYLRVQQAKADELVSFYTDLVAHARSAGAKKVGVMPWFFIPTVENTPPETLNTSCDTARIARIPGLDMVVVRMQPDNIFAKTMRTGDEMAESARLYYAEVLAHALGKDLIAVNNPTDEHTDYPACPLIPFDFFRDATLASLAAAPGGFTRHWYGQNYGKDDQHMRLLTDAAACTTRLGEPRSPVAFVFSYSGTRHAEPLTYETVFPHYWALAKHMAFRVGMPMLTFYADTLEQDLAEHPEVKVLVLEEHFPLTVEQMMAISRWWQTREKRSIIAFGAGLGFVAETGLPGAQPCARAHPGVFELIGLRQEEQPQLRFESPIALTDVARVRRTAFLGGNTSIGITRIANVRRVFGSRAIVLYEAESGEERVPVVAQWHDRSSLAVFCGFGLSEQTAAAAGRAINYALRECDTPHSVIDSCTEGVLWNVNKNDYIIISNLSAKKGRVVSHTERAYLWDCLEQKLLPDGDHEVEVGAKSFRMLRLVRRRSKFLDIHGVSYLRNLSDGAGRAELEVLAGTRTTLLLRALPTDTRVDGRPCAVTHEIRDGVYHVTLQQCQPGERKITLKW